MSDVAPKGRGGADIALSISTGMSLIARDSTPWLLCWRRGSLLGVTGGVLIWVWR
jgi:hypothetical protein